MYVAIIENLRQATEYAPGFDVATTPFEHLTAGQLARVKHWAAVVGYMKPLGVVGSREELFLRYLARNALSRQEGTEQAQLAAYLKAYREVEAYNSRLDREERVPCGEDYNNILQILARVPKE